VVTDVTAIGGLIGLALSVCLLAWQTRAQVQQTRISNSIAAATLLLSTTDALREVFWVFIETDGEFLVGWKRG
jgi:hypothetical protein